MPNEVKSIHFYFWDFCSEKIPKAKLAPLHLAICKFDTFVLQFVLHFDFLTQQNPKNQDGCCVWSVQNVSMLPCNFIK